MDGWDRWNELTIPDNNSKTNDNIHIEDSKNDIGLIVWMKQNGLHRRRRDPDRSWNLHDPASRPSRRNRRPWIRRNRPNGSSEFAAGAEAALRRTNASNSSSARHCIPAAFVVFIYSTSTFNLRNRTFPISTRNRRTFVCYFVIYVKRVVRLETKSCRLRVRSYSTWDARKNI